MYSTMQHCGTESSNLQECCVACRQVCIRLLPNLEYDSLRKLTRCHPPMHAVAASHWPPHRGVQTAGALEDEFHHSPSTNTPLQTVQRMETCQSSLTNFGLKGDRHATNRITTCHNARLERNAFFSLF